MKVEATGRGFPVIHFKDYYNHECSLQLSSIVDPECIWLGVDDADPQIMASKAASHGVQTKETVGWVPYPIPRDVLLSTRMHLTREQVAELIPHLQRFVDEGELEESDGSN